MDVFVGGKKVRLTQAEFKAQGGEGAVYVRGDTAYKVYADPAKMIPVAKMQELSVLTLPDVLRPQEVLRDSGQSPIGYTMRSVRDALVLCQTFSKAFRERAGLTPEKTLGLVQKLQEGVRHVHAHGLLIVDLNEMNFLVDPRFERVFFIDVDSYQTPKFAATALMDSVRDRHAQGFHQGTDWFAFAIVSFQMFVGIHPYKGKHPSLKTLDERMQQNISVLSPCVSAPAACLPLDVIPRAYRDWYRAVLEGGQRVPPPADPQAVVIVVTHLPSVPAGGSFVITKVLECAGAVVGFTHGITLSTEGVYASGRRCGDASAGARIALTPVTGHVVRATLEAGTLRLFDLTADREIPLTAAADQIAASDGRVYVKQGGGLLELEFVETPSQVWASLRPVGSVLEQATQLLEGVALQNLLGGWYASLLPRRGVCHQVRLPELDGSQVVDAKFGGGVLMIVAARGGAYRKLIFRFEEAFAGYDLRVVPDLVAPGVNFAVLANGVCLHLTDGDALEVFPARRGASGLRVITDPAVGGDCLLLADGNQALFARGNALYQFTMR